MGNQFESLKSKVLSYCLITLLLITVDIVQSQNIVEETIQIDTISETIKVIYKPSISTAYYTKKVAFFADDTSQVAIEKSYTSYGQNGLYKVYYPNGRLKIKTVFANNKINGEWTYYNKKGTILIKGNYQKGIKHGYWAYKSLKIYGRYKKELRNKRWYRIDDNNKKIKSFYKKGRLIKGKGFGEEKEFSPSDSSKTKKGERIKENKDLLNKEYQQAISFLTENVVFRKALKAYYSKGDLKKVRKLKKHFVGGKFQFVIAPLVMNLNVNSFVEDSKKGKIEVAVIDSVLKSNTDLQTLFSNKQVEENRMLFNNSNKTNSTMGVYFSQIHQHLLRIDVVNLSVEISDDNFEKKYRESEKIQIFEVLLYFDNKGKLKGAEYEKP